MAFKLAFLDFYQGLKNYRIWWYFAWSEIRQRYRRSILGPWWITLSMLIFITIMGIVYSRIFKENIGDYITYFAAGFLFWTFISGSILEATDLSTKNRAFIKQINLPFSLYIFKHLTRHLIFLLHNLIGYILIMIYFKKAPTIDTFLVIPGFILLFLNMYWITLFISILSARFFDLVPIITSCMQVIFFITPITWMPKLLNTHSYIVKLNPFVYLLQIVRAPLLGDPIMPRFWLANILFIVIGYTFAFYILGKCKNKIVFWVD